MEPTEEVVTRKVLENQYVSLNDTYAFCTKDKILWCANHIAILIDLVSATPLQHGKAETVFEKYEALFDILCTSGMKPHILNFVHDAMGDETDIVNAIAFYPGYLKEWLAVFPQKELPEEAYLAKKKGASC